MSDDQLIHPPSAEPEVGTNASESEGSAVAPTPAAPPAQPAYAAAGAPIPQPDYAPPGYMDEAYYPDMDSGSGIDLRRYVFAILRYKWLLVASLLVGLGGAYLAWTRTPVTYTAEGNLWIEVENRRGGAGDVAPIRPSGLLESNGWIELLRSYQVLDTVAVRERLLVQAPSEYAPAFEQFSLQMERFLPGGYELVVGQSGADYALSTAEGQLVQSGQFGAPIGENVGFVWNPARGSFPAEALVQFSVLSARDAAMSLNSRIDARMDRGGNFMSLTMSGRNPEQIASILNAVMDRHVEVAADMQSSKLRETLAILEEQLNIVSDSLDRAERDLQAWRVNTIAMPTDQSMPIAPGLEITRDPVFGNFFDMQVQVQEISRDRSRLQAVADGFGEEPVRIEALEMIPAAAASSELSQILGDLVDVRSELRSLRDRYTDDYGPIQDLRAQIRSIEEEAVPRVVNGLMAALETRQQELEGFVNQAARELEAIPPRTIEEGRLERRVLATENLYNDLRGRVESAQLAARSSIPSVRPLDRAATPRRPSQDRRLPLAAAILFGCVGAAMGGALLLDRLDARYRYASDVSRDIGLDILGSIPRIESTKGRRGVINAAQALEAFRELRIHIGFAYGNAGPITLAITSPSEGEGKSLISSNLAVAFSEVGRRTLLIDGDTRRGDAHRLLGRERSPGLIDYLRERSVGDIIQATEHPNLDFVGSGSRGVSTPELLASPRMAYFVGTLKRTYDVIIIDCPPLASGGDPLILGSLTGHLAVVIRTGSTEKLLAQAKIDQLSRLPVRILGAILNDVSAADSYHSYYASYLPSYEPVPEGDDVDPTQLLGEGAPAQDE